VIVEIGQQRSARTADGRMDIAVDPRRRHRRSLDIIGVAFGAPLRSNVPLGTPPGKGSAAGQNGYFGGIGAAAAVKSPNRGLEIGPDARK
jgi:hypothetical protein